jgi:D-beta-D-heptose 7-phosphate kinase/D-beta-D-heptose 1-phosphate adenosyltransferase
MSDGAESPPRGLFDPAAPGRGRRAAAAGGDKTGALEATPELLEAIGRLGRASALVVGDAMLDQYVLGQVERVSPEAPVPVLVVERELAMPGGAGNVVRNLGALGAAVAFVSVVGDDQAGSDLTGLIGGQPGVEPWLLVQGGRTTTTKTRMLAQGRQQLLRVDREDTAPIHPKLADRLLRIARDAMAATSVTILSDYRKGVLAGSVPVQLIAAARQAGRPVLANVRGTDFAGFAGADVVLLGRRDLARATETLAADDAGIAAAAGELRRAHGFGAVLVGRGQEGMTLVGPDGAEHLRGEAPELFDISGAIDTAVATLGAALATGAPLPLAARLAHLASGIAMGRVGTAVVREQDFLAALSPERGALRKIVSLETAAAQVERWRSHGWRTGFAQGSFDPLRPGHVHLLAQARAVCDRLVVAIAADAVVGRGKGAGRPFNAVDERAVQLAGLPTVDLVVVNEEDSPTGLLQALRPDVLVTGTERVARDAATAELLRGWGGEVMRAERLPEPA